MTDSANPGTDGQPTAGTEGKGAPAASLESLLNEFDKPKDAPKTEAKPTDAKAAPALTEDDVKAVHEYRADKARTAFEQAVNDTVKTAKEGNDTLKGVPDRLVRGALEIMAGENAKFRQAWIEREANPEKWSQVLKAASVEIAKDFDAIASNRVGRDQQRVRATIKGMQNDAPTPKQTDNQELSKMSDAQFRAYKKNLASQTRR